MNFTGVLLAALVPTWSVVQAPPAPEPVTAYHHLEKADHVIGMVVVDSRDQRVGRITDLAVDLEAGRVAEVLVDTGGRLTSKQRIVAVPPQSFVFMDSKNELRMNAELDAFDNAPEFNPTLWKDPTAGPIVADTYERFHLRPYSHIGALKPASKVIGMVARNDKDERLAKIEALIIDLPTGRLPEVIVASSGFLGMKGELTAVPPEGFIAAPNSDALTLDTTKEALKGAPHFKADDWRIGVNQAVALSSVDDSLQIPATSDINSINSSGAEADTVITEKIESKILVAPGLSIDARHVEVMTRDGRVTLRGIVDSMREKRQLTDIAASVVPVDHVDNQVQVKALAIASD